MDCFVSFAWHALGTKPSVRDQDPCSAVNLNLVDNGSIPGMGVLNPIDEGLDTEMKSMIVPGPSYSLQTHSQ